MTRYQLDECLNSKTLYRECNASGRINVKRFPSNLRNTELEDPEVLSTLAVDRTLVTSDNAFLKDNLTTIPVRNAGIVTVSLSPENPATGTVKHYRKILSNLKQRVPPWWKFDLSNSLLTVTETWVYVQHKDATGGLVEDGYFEFSKQDWETALQRILTKNASKKRSEGQEMQEVRVSRKKRR